MLGNPLMEQPMLITDTSDLPLCHIESFKSCVYLTVTSTVLFTPFRTSQIVWDRISTDLLPLRRADVLRRLWREVRGGGR